MCENSYYDLRLRPKSRLAYCRVTVEFTSTTVGALLVAHTSLANSNIGLYNIFY